MSVQSPLSAAERGFIQSRLANQLYDILIIGGGINGAGVAREAAYRGLRVALVEAKDFASGTSSRSSKLIHGGLRYLAQGELSLVREAANERQVLRRIAPHLAEPLRMLIPAYGRTPAPLLKLNAGLWMFERLAPVPPEEHYSVLNAKRTIAAEPSLHREHLCGAVAYYEFATDDARLVVDTLKSACEHGAVALNYAEVVGLARTSSGQWQAKVRETGGAQFEVAARCVVNAAGPWIESVARLAERSPIKLHLTKGVHLVFRHKALPITHCVVMQALDKRPVFAVPRGEIVYIGTTDTNYSGPLDDPAIGQADVEYLLEAVKRYFPATKLSAADLIATWAGLRPLLHQEGRKPSEISRKDEVTVSSSGLVTVAGGKLTTYRVMAKRVVEKALGLPAMAGAKAKAKPRSATADSPLSGGDLGGADSLEALVNDLTKAPPLARAPSQVRERLVHRYGMNALAVADCAGGDETALMPLAAAPVTAAEVRYATRSEMARTLCDLFERRTRLLLFAPEAARRAAEPAARVMGQELGWNEAERKQEVAVLRQHLAAVTAIEGKGVPGAEPRWHLRAEEG